jgi:hypothetical protein
VVVGWLRRKKDAYSFDVSRVTSHKPARSDVPVARCWTGINNIALNAGRFTVYRLPNGYHLVMQDDEGVESEQMIHMQGGFFSTLAAAYAKAAGLVSDMLLVSEDMPGGKHKAVLMLDVTPGNRPQEVVTIRLQAGEASGIRSSDAEEALPTAHPLEVLASAGGVVHTNRLPRFEELMAEPEAAQRSSPTTPRDRVRLWNVVDEQGQIVVEFSVFGGRGRYEVVADWRALDRRLQPATVTSIEEGYDRVAAEIAVQMAEHPDTWKALFVADGSSTRDAFLALSAIQRFDDGIWEQRRYNPETLLPYEERQGERVLVRF